MPYEARQYRRYVDGDFDKTPSEKKGDIFFYSLFYFDWAASEALRTYEDSVIPNMKSDGKVSNIGKVSYGGVACCSLFTFSLNGTGLWYGIDRYTKRWQRRFTKKVRQIRP